MKIKSAILTKNPCYTAGRKITIKGLMLHSVGCPQPKASVFVNSWNSASYGSACVHAFIDGNDGTVYQTLPWTHRGWHCGSGSKGSANNTHIGVEMCEPAEISYKGGGGFTVKDAAKAKACAKRTYESAVELFAYLCKEFSLDPLKDGVIISHNEGHSRGIATNHGDPEHLWNGLGMGYTMDGFRKDVKAAMGSASTTATKTETKTETKTDTVTEKLYRVRKSWAAAGSQIGAYKSLERAKAACLPWYTVYDENGKAVYSAKTGSTTETKIATPYKVKVSSSVLRIRKGPGTQYEAVGYTGKGAFTIIEESGGWGYLKSGKGWICLEVSCVERV